MKFFFGLMVVISAIWLEAAASVHDALGVVVSALFMLFFLALMFWAHRNSSTERLLDKFIDAINVNEDDDGDH